MHVRSLLGKRFNLQINDYDSEEKLFIRKYMAFEAITFDSLKSVEKVVC